MGKNIVGGKLAKKSMVKRQILCHLMNGKFTYKYFNSCL